MRLTHRAAWLICFAVGIGLVTLIIGIDYVGRFSDPGLRWLGTSTFVGLVAFAIWRLKEKLFAAAPSRLAIAQRVEAKLPELGSRLASAIEFHEQPIDDPSAGSTELRRAVVIHAEDQSKAIDFDSVIDREPLIKSYQYALLPTLLLAGLTLLIPQGVATGLMRLAMPWSNIAWPRQNMLSLVDPPIQLTMGENFELIAVDENNNLPNDLRAEYRYALDDQLVTDASPMQLVGNQGISVREAVNETFEYRVVGGDDYTMSWQELELVEPPNVSDIQIAITPPSYTGLANSISESSLKILEASELEVTAMTDQILQSAWLEIAENEKIDCEIVANASTSATSISQTWKAESVIDGSNKSTWSLALESESGSIGRTASKPYEVVKDTPPKVRWIEPSGDLFVTPQAEVLLHVSAKDNLATAKCWAIAKAVPLEGEQVNLEVDQETSDATTTNGDNNSYEISLYEADAMPPSRQSLNEAEQLDLQKSWDLRTLGLEAGTRLDVLVMAEDYRPGIGQTTLPRRVFLISNEEFEARLAKKQSLLLSEIQQALDRQRTAQEIAGSLLAEVESGKANDQTTLDRLAAGEFEQRQATQRVEDPNNGAAQLAKSLAEEVARNRLGRPELEAQLRTAAKELEATSVDSMTEAKRSLANARRAAKRDAQDETSEALAAATDKQSAAIESLEQIAQSLTSWSDFQQLAEELAQLSQKQTDLAERTAKLAAESATRNPLRATEIRAERQKLLGEQAEASRRFSKLQETMRGLLSQANESDRSESQSAVADAEQEANDRNISGGLREASRQLARNQLGRAAEQQKQSVEDLKEMLSTLRRKTERDPEELIRQLNQASEKLAELEKRVDESQRPAQKQSDATEQIAKETSRIARKLDRLTAEAASRSAKEASQSLANSQPSSSQQKPGQQGQQSQEGKQGKQSPEGQQGEGQQGAGEQNEQQQSGEQEKSQLADAEKSLQKAQKQIQQRIEEIQGEQAERLLDLLEKELPRFIASQKTILDGTTELNGSAAPDRGLLTQQLRDQQRNLKSEVSDFAVGLAPKPVFEHALGGAIEVMAEAGLFLEEEQLGRQTQRAEYIALQRLRHIEQVLKSHREQQEQQQQQGGEGSGEGGEPPKPLPFEVAELKMLRLMQLELIDLTDRYQSDRALAESREGNQQKPNPAPPKFDWNREANELSDQQKTLSELAFEMAKQDNETDEDE